jgi:cytochrome c
MWSRSFRSSYLLGLVAVLVACGARDEEDPAPAAGSGELTAEELEKGIGPVRSVTLGPIDETMRQEGQQLFEMLCTACHALDERRIGPPLRQVTTERAPEYIMNMMLNPTEMTERHPVARQLFIDYNFAPMADQNLTEDQARRILEYLRAEAEA